MANFTERAIVETLNEMLKTQTIDKITVKDLTDACGISRNTFYYHFHDIYEVLARSFIGYTDAILKAHEKDESWENTLIELLSFLYENRVAVNHVYKSVDGEALDRFLDKVVYHYTRSVVEEESGRGRFSERTISLAADFYKNALLGAVFGWIEENMKESPESLAHLYNSVFSGTIGNLLTSIERAL
ncbi:MAG: TetR family transcriptional regulator [Clostridiales bacterium]|nr:TetR family transcriptional regulator [Clostridiales bacterium]